MNIFFNLRYSWVVVYVRYVHVWYIYTWCKKNERRKDDDDLNSPYKPPFHIHWIQTRSQKEQRELIHKSLLSFFLSIFFRFNSIFFFFIRKTEKCFQMLSTTCKLFSFSLTPSLYIFLYLLLFFSVVLFSASNGWMVDDGGIVGLVWVHICWVKTWDYRRGTTILRVYILTTAIVELSLYSLKFRSFSFLCLRS